MWLPTQYSLACDCECECKCPYSDGSETVLDSTEAVYEMALVTSAPTPPVVCPGAKIHDYRSISGTYILRSLQTNTQFPKSPIRMVMSYYSAPFVDDLGCVSVNVGEELYDCYAPGVKCSYRGPCQYLGTLDHSFVATIDDNIYSAGMQTTFDPNIWDQASTRFWVTATLDGLTGECRFKFRLFFLYPIYSLLMWGKKNGIDYPWYFNPDFTFAGSQIPSVPNDVTEVGGILYTPTTYVDEPYGCPTNAGGFSYLAWYEAEVMDCALPDVVTLSKMYEDYAFYGTFPPVITLTKSN